MGKISHKLIIAAILIAAFSGGAVVYNRTRGYRNNNPGNIRHSGDTWRGQSSTQTDSAFVQFDSPEYGIRALGRVLLTYQNKYGLNTIRGIISKWAPSSENDTLSYVMSVSKQTGIGPDEKIDVNENLYGLAYAIIRHENGAPVLYKESTIRAGLSLV